MRGRLAGAWANAANGPCHDDAAAPPSNLINARRLTSRRNPVARRQRGKLHAPIEEESVEKIDACRVASGPGKAGHKAKLDRTTPDAEYDRNRRSRSFSRERGDGRDRRGDHAHPTANEIGHQRWQLIVFPFQPVVLDPHILAVDKTGFVETFAESSHKGRGGIGIPAIDKSDHRHTP